MKQLRKRNHTMQMSSRLINVWSQIMHVIWAAYLLIYLFILHCINYGLLQIIYRSLAVLR